MKWILLVLPAYLFWTCTHNADSNSKLPETPSFEADFVVRVDQLQLRNNAGPDAESVQELSKENLLIDLGEVSPFLTTIQIQGISHTEPWLKVRTADGQEGWVFAGGLEFKKTNTSVRIKKRVIALFGPQLNAEIESYNQSMQKARSSQDFALAFQKGQAFKSSMVEILQQKITVEPGEKMLDLFWLNDLLFGLATQVVGEARAYHIFWDYKKLQPIALKTSGSEDDVWIDLCFQIYNLDSIEYVYPSWYLQSSEQDGYSLLGKGLHFSAIQSMDSLLRQSRLFQSEVLHFKNLLLQDMTSKELSYWESQEKIVDEIEKILSGHFAILDKEDRVALETRLQQFHDPKTNAIVLNVRTGEN